MLQCKFSASEVLRKYVRYALNERPFTPDTVADLIHLRKVSGLTESEVADVLNDVAKRVVKQKGDLHSRIVIGLSPCKVIYCQSMFNALEACESVLSTGVHFLASVRHSCTCALQSYKFLIINLLEILYFGLFYYVFNHSQELIKAECMTNVWLFFQVLL